MTNTNLSDRKPELIIILILILIYSLSNNLQRFRRAVSDRYVSYSKLEELEEVLKLENIEQADQITAQILLTLAGRKKKTWLSKEDSRYLPCKYLILTDEIWRKYSDGSFGLSAQSQVWRQINGKLDNWSSEADNKFRSEVGWTNEKGEEKAITYSFSAPQGHFPALIHAEGILTVPFIASKLDSCSNYR